MPAPPSFNPFYDRLSRDIRNDLSSALLTCLQKGSMQLAEETANRFLAEKPDDVYRSYIEDRLHRYRQAVSTISGAVDDPFQRSFVLWDLELFFEMHEVLEHDWHHAEGETKLLMQALIRAAGVYIKRNCGLEPQARKIAAKALPVLERNRTFLANYFPPKLLIDALEADAAVPPRLLAGQPPGNLSA